MKSHCNVTGKTVKFADKCLNCARNIYAAVKEAGDGYIFSKSVHGKNLSNVEKQWVLLDDDLANKYTSYYDDNGKLKYKIKSCVDTFRYSFKETNTDTGEIQTIPFSVKEKRIVSFNPSLAKKQKVEIMKEVQKATAYATCKDITREELGDSAKYISVNSLDSSGKKIKPIISINDDKIDEDMKFAGYNMIETSELDMLSYFIFTESSRDKMLQEHGQFL